MVLQLFSRVIILCSLILALSLKKTILLVCAEDVEVKVANANARQ